MRAAAEHGQKNRPRVAGKTLIDHPQRIIVSEHCQIVGAQRERTHIVGIRKIGSRGLRGRLGFNPSIRALTSSLESLREDTFETCFY